MNFQNHTVLVTGAGGGIGRAIATAFVQAGANVMANDMDGSRLQETLTKLQSMGEDRIGTFVADVRDRNEVEALSAETLQRFGRIDILVNNAGIGPSTPVLEMADEEWDAVLATNLKGPFLLSRAVARHMVSRGEGGKIVNITSGSYKTARIGAAHYCASKAALAMLTKVLALELAEHRINVNSVAPGLIDIEKRSTPRQYVDAFTKMIPLGRMGRPDEVARAVLFLASKDAEYITGAILELSGGAIAGWYNMPRSR